MLNNLESSLKVLIIMQDVSGVGFNMHEACNRIVFTSIF